MDEFAVRFADRWARNANRLGDMATWVRGGLETKVLGRFDAEPVDADIGVMRTGIRAPVFTAPYTSMPDVENGQQIRLGASLYDIVDTDHRGRADRSGEWLLTLRRRD